MNAVNPRHLAIKSLIDDGSFPVSIALLPGIPEGIELFRWDCANGAMKWCVSVLKHQNIPANFIYDLETQIESLYVTLEIVPSWTFEFPNGDKVLVGWSRPARVVAYWINTK